MREWHSTTKLLPVPRRGRCISHELHIETVTIAKDGLRRPSASFTAVFIGVTPDGSLLRRAGWNGAMSRLPIADHSVTEKLVRAPGRLGAGADCDGLRRNVNRGSRLKIKWAVIGVNHHRASGRFGIRDSGIRNPINSEKDRWNTYLLK